jgi:phenylalanyl-tRNA synthetase beta chain
MKISLNWLKEYIDLNLSPAQIAKMLTSAGIEVDAIESIGLGFKKVVVGQVKTVQKHPNADNLVVANVTDGTDTYQVVCGAPNCREGLKTAFALVGAVLHDESGKEFKIKEAKLRGVESKGMLCSGLELGISDDPAGIMEFADHIPVGADVSEIYADTLFEVSLTPNLAHCNSIMGIARELSTLTGLPLKMPSVIVKEDSHDQIQSQVKVAVEDKVKCLRYACRLIKNVDIKSSPDWLKKKLESAGLRPINNVVDVTNFILLEMGHPMHAFNFDKLQGHQIIVKEAKENERFTTLDDKQRVLKSSDLMICDQAQPIAIAGVMGGLNSEVSFSTKNILLEAAYFQPSAIRKTSKRLGLSSESSKKFERGCDPNVVLLALDRAAMLIQELSGGTVVGGMIDVKDHDFPDKIITCRLSKVNSILGTYLGVSEVESIFNRLHFACQWNGQDAFTVTVPTYRVDVNAEIDLIEEVARIYGYDNIPKTLARYNGTSFAHSPLFLFEREVRSRLLAEGLQEFLTCDLIGPTLINIVQDNTTPEDSIVKVLNPTSIEQSVLRTSLLPGLLQTVKYNHDHQNHDVLGFEVGRIHFKKGDHFKEQSVAGVILTGKSRFHHWDSKPRDVDFYDLKGILENVFHELRIPPVRFAENALAMFHSGRQASIYVDSLEIGSFGEIHPAVQRRLDVPQRIYFAEFNLHDLIQVRQPEQKMVPFSIFPSSERDLTLTLPEALPIEKIVNMIHSIKSLLLESVSVLDIYRSEKIGKDKKNVTLRFVYRDVEKTVEQETVEKEHLKIVKDILESFVNTLLNP